MLPFQSTGWRLAKTIGFALLWAAFFGLAMGALVFYRVPRGSSVESPPWHLRLRLALESLELRTYDWRARELGERSERTDAVVPIAIDDEALASARESSSAEIAAQPWPREILGGLGAQAIREGASLVLFDLPLSDLSARTCGPTLRDDDRFRSLLDEKPNQTLLTFDASPNVAPPAERELRPYLLLAGAYASSGEANEGVRRVLSEREPAFLVPADKGVELWAGVSSEQRGRELHERWGLSGTPTVRRHTAADQAHEIAPWRLLVSLSEVQVEGLDPSKLARARSLEGPVAVLLSDKSDYGLSMPSVDFDGVARAFPQLVHFVSAEGTSHLLPSAPLAVAMRLAGTRALRYQNGRLWIGDRYSLPMDETGHSLIRFEAVEVSRGSRGSLRRSVSAWKVLVNLLDHEQGRKLLHHDNELNAKVALLTDASSRSGESLQTPAGRSPRGAVLGQAVGNLLRSEGLRRASPRDDFALAFGMALLGALLAVAFATALRARAGPVPYALSLLLPGAGYVWAARHVFLEQGLWIAIAGPLIAMAATFLAATGYAAALERRIREFLTGAMGLYTSPELTRRLERDLKLMRPDRRELTVCFVDLDGFGKLSRELEPEKVVALLGEFFSVLSPVVQHSRGHVDKYVADSLMAFWGAPLPLEGHELAGCEAALRMREAIAAKREMWKERFGQEIEFRISINTGQAVVGDMGAERRANYTAMGEAVAVASKLEELNRFYGTFILVGEKTQRAASARFMFREVDRLASSEGAVSIYELWGRKGELSEERSTLLAGYEAAFSSYLGRRFAAAGELFSQLAQKTGDPLCRRYVDRCRELAARPPPDNWDGVFEEPRG